MSCDAAGGTPSGGCAATSLGEGGKTPAGGTPSGGFAATSLGEGGKGLTEIPEEVEEYLRIVETDTPRQCPEQHALAAYVRKVFREEQLRVESGAVVPHARPVVVVHGALARVLPGVVREGAGHLVEGVVVVGLHAEGGAVVEVLAHGGAGRVHVVGAAVAVAVGHHVVVSRRVLHPLLLEAALRLGVRPE